MLYKSTHILHIILQMAHVVKIVQDMGYSLSDIQIALDKFAGEQLLQWWTNLRNIYGRNTDIPASGSVPAKHTLRVNWVLGKYAFLSGNIGWITKRKNTLLKYDRTKLWVSPSSTEQSTKQSTEQSTEQSNDPSSQSGSLNDVQGQDERTPDSQLSRSSSQTPKGSGARSSMSDSISEPCHSVAQLLDVLFEMEDEEGPGIVMHEETEDGEELEGAVGGDIRQRFTLHPLPEPEDQASQYQASLTEVNFRLMHHRNGPSRTTQNTSGEGQANHIVHGTPPGIHKDIHKVAVISKVNVTHSDTNRMPFSEVPNPFISESHTESGQDYLERPHSFSRWPKSDTVTPDQLAKARFYYTGEADRVWCAYCNKDVDFWLPTDCQLEKHRAGCAQRRKGISERDRMKEILKTLGQSDEAIRQAVNFLQHHNIVINARNVLEVIFAQEDGKKLEELLDQLKREDTNLGNKIQILTELGFQKEMVKRAVTIAEEGKSTKLVDTFNILVGMESEHDRHESHDQDKEERILLCSVCLDARICVLFLPCRHLVTCETCGIRFLHDRCPVCRKLVSDVHYPVYF